MTDRRARDQLMELLRTFFNASGNTAELGVWQGATARVFLDALPLVHHWAIDTFEGIPENGLQQEETHLRRQFACPQIDELRETSRVEQRLHLIEGEFPDVELPEQEYLVVFYDADTGKGVHDFLDYFWSRVKPGGLLIFHDFAWRACPGVTRALRPFWDIGVLHDVGMLTYIEKPAQRCLPSIG